MAEPMVAVSQTEGRLEGLIGQAEAADNWRSEADQAAGDQDAAGCDAANRTADAVMRALQPLVAPLARVVMALERQQAVQAAQETLGACEDAGFIGPFNWIACERPGCDVCDAMRMREERDAELLEARTRLGLALEQLGDRP
jgi:hypothetical protein